MPRKAKEPEEAKAPDEAEVPEEAKAAEEVKKVKAPKKTKAPKKGKEEEKPQIEEIAEKKEVEVPEEAKAAEEVKKVKEPKKAKAPKKGKEEEKSLIEEIAEKKEVEVPPVTKEVKEVAEIASKEPVGEEKPAEAEEEEAGAAIKKGGEALLFMRWPYEGVEIKDLGLKKYINLREVMIPHSGGRHEHKRFWKSNISIVERLVNKIMAPGLVDRRIKGRGASQHAGKKAHILAIIERAMSIVELKTGQNPIQVLVNAVQNAAPREETTRISLGGITYQQAVDISPQRRVDMSLKNLVQGAIRATYNNVKTVEECYADEIIAAGNDDNQGSGAIKRKEEMERIAISAR